LTGHPEAETFVHEHHEDGDARVDLVLRDFVRFVERDEGSLGNYSDDLGRRFENRLSGKFYGLTDEDIENVIGTVVSGKDCECGSWAFTVEGESDPVCHDVVYVPPGIQGQGEYRQSACPRGSSAPLMLNRARFADVLAEFCDDIETYPEWWRLHLDGGMGPDTITREMVMGRIKTISLIVDALNDDANPWTYAYLAETFHSGFEHSWKSLEHAKEDLDLFCESIEGEFVSRNDDLI
jgi:hypothetical protein